MMATADSGFLLDLGIKHPIIQAPMSGGATTPELVAAVSNAGGLGSLGAAYLAPDQIASDIRAIRALTGKPFNVNLFAGGYTPEVHVDSGPMLDVLAEIHQFLGLPAPALPAWPPNLFDEQLEVILQARPAVFSFTFGIPDADAMARLRGTFAGPFETSMIPTLELVRTLSAAVSTPLFASGGLMDGRDIAVALASGAVAAQLGTAFLTCPEAGTPKACQDAMLAARTDTTVITRVFSGRPARGLFNTFIARLDGRQEIILPFPMQNALTRPMRNAAAKQGAAGFLSLFAGQGVTRSRAMPAAQLVERLVAEMNEVRTAGA
jgi:nitronate monooxygenase